MKKLIQLLLMSVLLLSGCFAQAVPPLATPALKSYKEWKGDKVQAAVNQILRVRNQVLKAHSESDPKTAEVLQRQMSQLQWNLEVANDLSVADYFVLYLSQQNQPDRFQQAAQKLIPTEVAELMEAYSNALGISSGSTITTSAVTKLPSQATKN